MTVQNTGTSDIKVFTARKVITMDPTLPEATAVAVRDGLVLEVGSLETLKPWLDRYPHSVDRQFEDKILMPGFIDPHLHPSMAAVILQMEFLTAMEWRLPWGTVQPVKTQEAFFERLKELSDGMEDPDAPLFTWGYHRNWHGEITKPMIDEIVSDRPVILWHRSFHEIIVNSKALEWMEITRESLGNHPQANFDHGHFFEMGLHKASSKLTPYLMAPERAMDGLNRLREVAHFGGHTTLGDMAVGIFDLDMEFEGAKMMYENDQTPFRIQMIANAMSLSATNKSHQNTLELIDALPERNTHRLRFSNHVKLFTDGAFFSQLMQLGEPGYLDGHHGEWLMPPESFEEAAKLYWNSGYRIHVHCTGDMGLELALDMLDKLQWERPRFDHRYTIEHFGLSTPEQVRRLKALGGCVSANVYYLHELGDVYARAGIGYERASQIGRLGSCVREGIPTALHSDYTMAPALPLNSAWVAVNRVTSEGNVMAPTECLSVEEALKAITIEAAYVMGLENEVGSLRAGKKADMVVLEQDPYEIDPMALKDIPIWGTIFEGAVFPIKKSNV